MGTYGPDFDERLDGERIRTQLDCIREYMLSVGWKSLQEIKSVLRYPESSISAQLRHLRKERFGAYVVEKRRRGLSGTWEYQVSKPILPAIQGEQTSMFEVVK